jgi:hypothetical protein
MRFTARRRKRTQQQLHVKTACEVEKYIFFLFFHGEYKSSTVLRFKKVHWREVAYLEARLGLQKIRFSKTNPFVFTVGFLRISRADSEKKHMRFARRARGVRARGFPMWGPARGRDLDLYTGKLLHVIFGII